MLNIHSRVFKHCASSTTLSLNSILSFFTKKTISNMKACLFICRPNIHSFHNYRMPRREIRGKKEQCNRCQPVLLTPKNPLESSLLFTTSGCSTVHNPQRRSSNGGLSTKRSKGLMQSPPYNSYPGAGLLTAHFVLIGHFCCSLFLAYLKFGVFIDILLGVVFFCELLFFYFWLDHFCI